MKQSKVERFSKNSLKQEEIKMLFSIIIKERRK